MPLLLTSHSYLYYYTIKEFIMPGNPRVMIHKSRLDQNELELKSNIYRMNHSLSQLTRKRNPAPRTKELMSVICQLFSSAIKADPRTKRLPATDFEFLRDDYSPPTIIKAKRLLGIKSVRRDGFWFWTPPQYEPDEAIEHRIQKKIEDSNEAAKQVRIMNQASAQTLTELMTTAGLICKNDDILAEMLVRGYQRSTVLAMKARLGISSKKIGPDWMWIWGNRTVQDWLEKYLSAGPQPVEKVLIDAWAEQEWVDEVVYSAKQAVRTVILKRFNDKIYWMDLNAPGEIAGDMTGINSPQTWDQPANDNREVIIPRRTITVDFSQEEIEPDDDIPEEFDSTETVTPAGVRIVNYK